MSTQGDLTGTTLSHYRILEPLGAGGMGVVYRAHDERLERDVAIKVLPPGAFVDDHSRKRFRKEALALSKLNHPNIATVHDFDSQAGLDFLVMELVSGSNLNERIAEGPLPDSEIAHTGEQIAEGLAAAHEQGIIHRDIKPSNVRLTPDGRVKILDFGLARRAQEAVGVSTTDTMTEMGAVVGTLPYMPPEQLRGDPLDGRADLYSLGALLYEAATGQRPFEDPSGPRLIGSILSDRPRPPHEIRRGVAPELERIVLKCLEKDPKNRYQSARELGVDLRRFDHPKSELPDRAAVRRTGIRGLPWIAAGLAAALTMAAIVFDLGDVRTRVFGTTVSSVIPSLAVLPLTNLTGQADEDFFADGMTEELITRLAQLRGLKVISRTSAMQYKGAKKSLSQIAKELDVKLLLEGAVQRAADQVRITAKLIDAASGQSLWADTFEGSASNVLVIQSDVARAIVERIRVRLTPSERSRLTTAAAVNPQAHALYLKGRYYLTRYDVESFKRGTESLVHALELDPNHAPTYAALAESYVAQSYLLLPPREAMPLARAYALKALEIDSTMGDAYNSLAYVTAFYEWNWKGAEVGFRRALDLNPGSANAHQYYGYYLAVNARFEEAAAELEQGHELDPMSEYISFSTLWPIYNARRYHEAIRSANELILANPRRFSYYQILGQAYLGDRQFNKAIEALEVAAKGTGTPIFQAWLGHAYAAAGRKTEALEVLSEMKRAAAKGFIPAYAMAVIYAGLGDRDEAFTWLNRGIEDRSEDMVWLKVDPGMDVLRSDPRYRNILGRVGFEF